MTLCVCKKELQISHESNGGQAKVFKVVLCGREFCLYTENIDTLMQ